MDFNQHTAEVLIEALPYINRFRGHVFVVKYGGHAMVDEDIQANIISDIVLMQTVGMLPIIVHGGGPDINKMLEKEGIQSKFISGLRVTDEASLDVAHMVLVGKVNQKIVASVQKMSANAVGFSGVDGWTIHAKKKQKKDAEGRSLDLGYVGEIDSIDTSLIQVALEKGYIPVIAPIGLDAQGQRYNINSDTVAAAIAGAVKADKIFLLTDTDGILNKEMNRISCLQSTEIDAMIKNETISGGMIPKAVCCQQALEDGVQSAHIVNGTRPHSLLLELFTDEGVGTMVTRG